VLNFSTKAPGRGESVAAPASTTQTWRFGVFEVDTRRVELRRGGTPVKLREQSFFILVYLLEHAGEIVAREELRELLWPSDTFVDFDHSLNMAVLHLRQVLGDSTETPLYIETIPKRGYRFIAPVTQMEDPRNGPANENGSSAPPAMDRTRAKAQAASSTIETPVRQSRLRLASAIVGLVILVAAGFLIFVRSRHLPVTGPDRNAASPAFQIVPVTTAPGHAVLPAISPDGTWVAYIWDGPERRYYNLYLQLIGSDSPLRITDIKSGRPGEPAWSPDGREIAFSLCDGKNDGVYVVPTLGGSERKLTSVDCQNLSPGPLAWLSDGKGILMIDRCAAGARFGVVLFSLATGEKQCLTNSSAPTEISRVFQFSLSPDGKTIAFNGSPGVDCFGDIYTIPISGGTLHQLTAEGHCFADLMWSPDGKSIAFTSNRSTLPSLWRVSANGGPIQPEAAYPAIGRFSKDGRRLVYSDQTSVEGPAIWRADLATAGGPVLNNKVLIKSQYMESDAQPSLDGAKIVWMSKRSGFAEIWMSSATGGNPFRLTHLDYAGSPRWSPDGKWIAFDVFNRNSSQIFVVDSQGRNLHPITDGPYYNGVPSWSRDGRSIYFASIRTGSWQVWKHSMEDGSDAQVTKQGGFDPFESYDGRTIYFSKYDQAGIWSSPASGGMESLVVADKPQVGYWGHWAVTRTGLYLLNIEADPKPRIEFYDFATRRTSPVLTIEKKSPRLYPSLSATADGRTIYYTQYDRQSVIKMMEISR